MWEEVIVVGGMVLFLFVGGGFWEWWVDAQFAFDFLLLSICEA